MLNEWSDRPPPEPPGRPFWRRLEYWVALYALTATAALALDLAKRLSDLIRG
jgi:hypothetical protein